MVSCFALHVFLLANLFDHCQDCKYLQAGMGGDGEHTGLYTVFS